MWIRNQAIEVEETDQIAVRGMANDEGVYSLITKLCENQLAVNNRRVRNEDVARLRAKSFQLLLFPKKPISDQYWLENCNSLEMQYLAWQYNVACTFKQPELASTLESLYHSINDSNWDAKHAILQFLLKLRKPPQKPKEVVSRLPESGYRIFHEDDFHLGPLANLSNKFSSRPLDTMSLQGSELFLPDDHAMSFSKLPSSTNSNDVDEGCMTSLPETNNWDLVSNITLSERRTWEAIGNPSPESEKSFFSEASADIYALMDKMLLKQEEGVCEPLALPKKVLSREEYMRDLKYVVLGIESFTFQARGDLFILNPNVLLDGISYHIFQRYSCLMIKCGICFKALQSFVSEVTSANATVEKYGAIYVEFCNAVSRYLLFYHAATFKFDDHKGLLQLHAYFRKLSQPLFAVASICKVGTYKEPQGNSAIPSGVNLLNYLYECIFRQYDKNVHYVLLGLLFPCFQIYFIRYLRPWLLEGVVDDPHNEFFIKASTKYLATRNRVYWTRAFTIADALLPNFLSEHAASILNCGKSANLLKLCMPKSAICQYFMAHKHHLVQCCITQEMLQKLERCNKAYELEMMLASGGTPFSLRNWLAMKEDEKLLFSKCLAAKRAAAIKRIQQRRMDKICKENEAKKERHRALREDYDKQLASKQEQKIAELARELKEEEKLMALQERADALIQDEAARMIAYYEQLTQNASHLNQQLVEASKKIHLNEELINIEPQQPLVVFDKETNKVIDPNDDAINANSETMPETIENVNKAALTEAQRNRQRVMGTSIPETGLQPSNTNLTEAQRNKMKVMAEEYGETISSKSELEVNRDYAQRSKLTFSFNDNDNFVNKNISTQADTVENNNNPLEDGSGEKAVNVAKQIVDVPTEGRGDGQVEAMDNEGNVIKQADVSRKAKGHHLKLDVGNVFADGDSALFTPYLKTPNFELLRTDSLFTATATASLGGTPMYENLRSNVHLDLDCPMRMSLKDVTQIQRSFVGDYIRCSVMLPLQVQTGLLRAELLKHFIVEQNYLDQLENLRNYYFLLDGEYCRDLTDDLYTRLYGGQDAQSFYGITALTPTITSAKDNLRVRVCVKALPNQLDLGHINALDCISLSYDVKWPLNILLPADTLAKYDDIFKFLLKVHRVAWVLHNICMDLRMLNKQYARQAVLLSFSPHYQKIQLCRHIMTQFIQTFRSYIVGEVLQSGWVAFQDTLNSIENLDDLYAAHANYIKQIYFLCLLNQNSAPVRKVVINIFSAILKFYDYMRSREWVLSECEFEHPNYDKLVEIFDNFMLLAKYFFKVGRKVVRAAYQPQFAQLIDLLDINGYYSARFQEA